MVIEMKWNNKDYKVTNFDVAFHSSGSNELADCVPGEIRVSLEIAPTAAPGKDFFSFAKTQLANAKSKGTGQITVFKGKDGNKEGQALQTVKFAKAWLTDLDTNVSEHDSSFSLGMTIAAADITISGTDFKHKGREKLLSE